MLGASAVGLIAAFWQLMEKLAILKNKDVALSCNLNDVFSCSNVLSAHQSSILGPPNSVIGIIMFTMFLTVAVVGITGAKTSRRLMLAVQGLALFMLGFTLWFLFESTYSIESICIFCLFIGTAVVIINSVLFRHNFSSMIAGWKIRGIDYFGWTLLWLIVALAMVLKFA